MRNSFLKSLLLTSVTIGATFTASSVSAQELISNEPLTLAQVTNVNEFGDVTSDHWAFTAVQRLVEEYGCVEGYPPNEDDPNPTFRGGRAITRYEAAAIFTSCLDVIIQVIERELSTASLNQVSEAELITAALNQITEEDLAAAILSQLTQEDLAALQGSLASITASEADLTAQEDLVAAILSQVSQEDLAAAILKQVTQEDLVTVILSQVSQEELATVVLNQFSQEDLAILQSSLDSTNSSSSEVE